MYLDPGFGSMVIQAIVAAVAAVSAYFLIFRKKITGKVHPDKQNAEQAAIQNITENGTSSSDESKTVSSGEKTDVNKG